MKRLRKSPQAPPPPIFSISFPNGGPGIGKGEGGPSFLSSAAAPPDELRPKRWGEKRCVREFANYVRGGSTEEIKDAMDRLDCWHACIAQFTRGPGHDPALGAGLLGFWMGFGINRIPAGLKEDLPIFVDALKHHLPVHSGPAITLYRGEDAARYRAGVYGIAWTSNLDVAEMFADRRQGWDSDKAGVVLRIEASQEMIVIGPTEGSIRMAEDEYIVDPRLIRTAVVVP